MIVRNLNDKEVLETTYIAHGGAIAQMILDRRILKEIGFLAIASLEAVTSFSREKGKWRWMAKSAMWFQVMPFGSRQAPATVLSIQGKKK